MIDPATLVGGDLGDRLLVADDGTRFRVRTAEGLTFTIEVRVHPWGVRGYGRLRDGEAKVGPEGHMMLTPDVVRAWAERLTEEPA